MTRRVPRVRTPRRATTTRRAPPLLGALLGAALLSGCTSQPPSSTPASAPTLSASVSAATTPAASPGATVTDHAPAGTGPPRAGASGPTQGPFQRHTKGQARWQRRDRGDRSRTSDRHANRRDRAALADGAAPDTLYLAPFTPTEQRVREGGRPLHFAWTKWVDGPGRAWRAGRHHLAGLGPAAAPRQLSIPLIVTRRRARSGRLRPAAAGRRGPRGARRARRRRAADRPGRPPGSRHASRCPDARHPARLDGA